MNDPTDDEALLALFRAWLTQTRAEADSLSEAEPIPSPHEPEVGLYRLIEEFTALRQEVKLETKGSRGLQEQVEALLPTIRQAIDQIRNLNPREEQAAQTAARPLAEAIADLDEALDRGRREVERARDRARAAKLDATRATLAALDAWQARQPWYRRLGLRDYHAQIRALIDPDDAADGAEPNLFDALIEGYDLIQARLRRALETGRIDRIDCVGAPVDPQRMTVVEAVDAPDVAPGHVVDEVRRGYTWRGRVLRFAEVRAARSRPVRDQAEDEDEDDVEELDQFEADELGSPALDDSDESVDGSR